jgi:transcriptional regulator with XRE-family HTH domain
MPASGPTVARRQLGRRLKRLREAAGITAEQVEEAGLASRTKIWRIEAGKVRVTVPDVWALTRLYGTDQAEADVLAGLAQRTAARGRWQQYGDVVPEWFRLYVGLEDAASHIRTFEDSVVPGELQTADYARALWHGARPDLPVEAVDPHVHLRLDRQRALFERRPAPRLQIVLGENVLRRQVGGPAVLAEQVRHLAAMDGGDDVDIRVLPFSAGAHPAVTGAFRILSFDDDQDPDVVYVEWEVAAHYLERAAEVETYRRIFALLVRRARPIGEFTR